MKQKNLLNIKKLFRFNSCVRSRGAVQFESSTKKNITTRQWLSNLYKKSNETDIHTKFYKNSLAYNKHIHKDIHKNINSAISSSRIAHSLGSNQK